MKPRPGLPIGSPFDSVPALRPALVSGLLVGVTSLLLLIQPLSAQDSTTDLDALNPPTRDSFGIHFDHGPELRYLGGSQSRRNPDHPGAEGDPIRLWDQIDDRLGTPETEARREVRKRSQLPYLLDRNNSLRGLAPIPGRIFYLEKNPHYFRRIPYTADVDRMVAASCAAVGLELTADHYYHLALADGMHSSLLGWRHPETQVTIQGLVNFYQRTDQPLEARAMMGLLRP